MRNMNDSDAHEKLIELWLEKLMMRWLPPSLN
jgi:hypothetical protein